MMATFFKTYAYADMDMAVFDPDAEVTSYPGFEVSSPAPPTLKSDQEAIANIRVFDAVVPLTGPGNASHQAEGLRNG